jgi:excisionase family DNA binding protein
MMDAEMPGTSRFLTLADTAELLNVSASQVYALVRSGELPAIKVGGHGHWRIERTVLETYVADRYEETRRMGLWNQSEFASLQDLAIESAGVAQPLEATRSLDRFELRRVPEREIGPGGSDASTRHALRPPE